MAQGKVSLEQQLRKPKHHLNFSGKRSLQPAEERGQGLHTNAGTPLPSLSQCQRTVSQNFQHIPNTGSPQTGNDCAQTGSKLVRAMSAAGSLKHPPAVPSCTRC